MNKTYPNFNDIEIAHKRIQHQIHRTPVLTCTMLNEMFNCELFFKCENFQKVGAFKFRGASNAVLSCNEKEVKNGVATHSSGNHAAALALAAKLKNIKAHIVMPENSPQIKIDAVRNYGAEITFCIPTLEARETTLTQVVEKTGALVIHPYDNPLIIAGQGTCAKELLEDYPNLDIVMAPVGGGGLLSGTLLSVKHINKNIQVFASEPEMANDAFLSLQSGAFVPQKNPQTIADGLRTTLGEITYPIIKELCDNIICVTEQSIINATRLIWERMKIVVEPSSATVLAAVMEHNQLFKEKKVGLIISGGNVDFKEISKLF